MASHNYARTDFDYGVEADVAFGLAARDVDLGRSDDVDVILVDGLRVELGKRSILGRFAVGTIADYLHMSAEQTALGILDGKPGLTYCILRSIYEYMIDVKVKELRSREKGLPT